MPAAAGRVAVPGVAPATAAAPPRELDPLERERLTAPLLALRRAGRRKDIPVETVALALIMIGNVIYLIPNSALSPLGWLMAGALAGFVQFDRTADHSSDVAPGSEAKKRTRYTRFAARQPQDVPTGMPQRRSTSNP